VGNLIILSEFTAARKRTKSFTVSRLGVSILFPKQRSLTVALSEGREFLRAQFSRNPSRHPKVPRQYQGSRVVIITEFSFTASSGPVSGFGFS
jgi:hypothetical protein